MERERDGEGHTYIYIYVYIYINNIHKDIYIHTQTDKFILSIDKIMWVC